VKETEHQPDHDDDAYNIEDAVHFRSPVEVALHIVCVMPFLQREPRVRCTMGDTCRHSIWDKVLVALVTWPQLRAQSVRGAKSFGEG
jgi:hypothetical protein